MVILLPMRKEIMVKRLKIFRRLNWGMGYPETADLGNWALGWGIV